MRRTLILIVVAAANVCAGQADASQLTIGRTCDKYMSCEHTATYIADPGEANDVSFTVAETAFVVTDPGAAIRFPAGTCMGDGGHGVTCDLVPLQPLAPLTVRLGDGNDRANSSAAPLAPATLDGGPGNDVLVGGSLYDVLIGGPGNDLLDGRDGVDLADYEDHPGGISADLVSGRATAPGEQDALAGIESLRGGAGRDVLVGDAGANKLTGGGGKDVIRGGAGIDEIAGEGALDGGDGDDALRLTGPGSAACGGGTQDRVTARAMSSIVDDQCELVGLSGVTIRPKLGHRDPSKDRIEIPLLELHRGELLVARLATRGGRRLGSLRRPITNSEGRGGHTTLRFSSAGAAFVRRRARLDVVLTVRRERFRPPFPSARPGAYGGTVRLRIGG